MTISAERIGFGTLKDCLRRGKNRKIFMEKNETAKNYLLDLGREIILLANKSNSSVDKNGIDYELGRSYAYYEILSLMKNQAAAFGLNNNDIGIGDFSIESLLKG